MKDETVSTYINQLQRRYPEFRREHDAELKDMSHDVLARLFNEHIIFGNRNNYEALLQTMLTAEERERLQTDAQFTRAWRIFVDLCWTRKQIKRAALFLVVIVVLMVLVVLFFLALPHVAKGPLS